MKRFNVWDECESLTGDMIYFADHEAERKKLNRDCEHFMEMNNNLAEILDSKDAEIKKLRDALNLIMIKCTDHDEYSFFEDYKQLANDIISITREALKDHK